MVSLVGVYDRYPLVAPRLYGQEPHIMRVSQVGAEPTEQWLEFLRECP